MDYGSFRDPVKVRNDKPLFIMPVNYYFEMIGDKIKHDRVRGQKLVGGPH